MPRVRGVCVWWFVRVCGGVCVVVCVGCLCLGGGPFLACDRLCVCGVVCVCVCVCVLVQHMPSVRGVVICVRVMVYVCVCWFCTFLACV